MLSDPKEGDMRTAAGIIFVGASFACLVGTVSFADDAQNWEAWLGPQSNKQATLEATLFQPVVGSPVDQAKDPRISNHEISLRVVKGADLRIPQSENPTVTFSGTAFQQTAGFRPDPNALYLVGQMQLKKGQLGERFYTLNVRIKDGPLKGAVVHLRDGNIQESIKDPCTAVYRLPADLKVNAEAVPFEVVAIFAK
jgi:hypothetical protein